MTFKTILLPIEKAKFIQNNAAGYNCNLVAFSMFGNCSAKVTVTGENDNVKRLFEQIGER